MKSLYRILTSRLIPGCTGRALFCAALATNSLTGKNQRRMGAARILISMVLMLVMQGMAWGQSQTYNSGGTFVVPAGVTSITVNTWGGGGAGGGSTNAGISSGRGGAGGGGGAFASSILSSLTPGNSITVVVAGQVTGGSGTTVNSNGPSFVGPDTNPSNALVRAAGGSGGTGNTSGGSPAGGAGGTVANSVGTTRTAGVTGGNGATATFPSSASSGAGGAGANSGGAGGTSITSGTSVGNTGNAPGGAGGGGRTSQYAGAEAGGVGSAGRVTITWTCPTVTSIAYTTPICKTSTSSSPTLVGTSGGTYSSSPTGLSINSSTGAINASASTAGTYTVTYGFAAETGYTTNCPAVSANTSVTIEASPVAGTLTKTPNNASVCIGTNVSASLTAGSGGNGTDELQFRTNNGSSWSSWAAYTSGNNISTTGKIAVEIQTRRLAAVCTASGYTTASWTIEATPVAGTLTKSPNNASVCAGTNVSATLTAGSGGNSTDEIQYRNDCSCFTTFRHRC